MNTDITPARRAELAELHGLSDPYLYQCLTGRKEMDAAEAVRIEKLTAGEIKRWMLRSATWHRIWPELIGTEGAPPVPPEPPEPQPEAVSKLTRFAENPTAAEFVEHRKGPRRERDTPIAMDPDPRTLLPGRRRSDLETEKAR